MRRRRVRSVEMLVGGVDSIGRDGSVVVVVQIPRRGGGGGIAAVPKRHPAQTPHLPSSFRRPLPHNRHPPPPPPLPSQNLQTRMTTEPIFLQTRVRAGDGLLKQHSKSIELVQDVIFFSKTLTFTFFFPIFNEEGVLLWWYK